MLKKLSTLASQISDRSARDPAPVTLLQDPLDKSIEEVDKDLNDAARDHVVETYWGGTKRNDGNRAFSAYLKEWKETLNDARLGKIPFDGGSSDRPSISTDLQLHRCQLRDMETYSNDIGRPDSQFTKGHEAKVRKYCSQVLRVVAGVPRSTVISEQDAIEFLTLGNRCESDRVPLYLGMIADESKHTMSKVGILCRSRCLIRKLMSSLDALGCITTLPDPAERPRLPAH